MRVTRLVQAIVVLIPCIAGCVRNRALDASAQANPAVAIFAALRDSLGAGHPLYLQWRTCGVGPLQGIGSPDSTRLAHRLADVASRLQVPDALMRALLVENAERIPVESEWFANEKVIVVREPEVSPLEATGIAVFEVSRPVVSADGKIAVVYAGWTRGAFGAPGWSGYAQLYRLERGGSGYRVTRTVLVWTR